VIDKPIQPPSARVALWLVESRLPDQVGANVEQVAQAEDVQHVAIMPDVHLGREINNGTVLATRHLVYPQAVGGDIGCGIAEIRFSDTTEVLQNDRHVKTIIRELYRRVPAFKQRGGRRLPERLTQHRLSHESLVRKSEREGAYQIGTLGCGNHFAELQEDDAGMLWFMVHSGSRAMGQLITEFHLSRSAASVTGLRHLDSRSAPGQDYLNDMEWAKEYAMLNRLAIMAAMAQILEAQFKIKAEEVSYIDCPHNFVRREHHFGSELLVHRKSAISARLEEPGLVAGSMGTPSYIVRGLGLAAALCSSSHGAGRILSRTEARRAISQKAMERQLARVRYDERHLRALRDEAPGAYRDIAKVMRAQRELTRQIVRLAPRLNFKYPDPRKAE
jgi:tRNA-splicing ligase RtcB